MKVIIVLLAACVVCSMGQDCSAKIKQFHDCLAESHKKAKEDGKAKFEAMKAKLDACYTDNGCTPPAKGKNSSASSEEDGEDAKDECRKAVRAALKEKFDACIKQAIPNFSPPPKDGQRDKGNWGGRGGWNHKDENKNLDGCAKKEAVRDCKRAIFNSTRPTDAEKKARFQAKCDAKAKCQASLGADCQAQMEKFKKAACECRQQQQGQKDQIRAGIPVCQGVPQGQGNRPQGGNRPQDGSRPQGRDQKPQSCDQKDYCKLGYEAFVQDHPKGDWGHH